ncbi:beta-propeller fold lactonase family protein [Arthrobacter oryzae]|uniref:beta-propeller fold lactonase family protein n=1 Tax=Arthrobacter oryzae TaxID=409290 RepID=UPI00142E5963|nr:beta-propeller fold lactonase family protein [Arthrobacter oryzae]
MTVVLCGGLVVASGSLTATPTEAATPAADASPTPSSSTPNDAPVISTTAVPDGIVGQHYHVALAAKGGFGPYTWSISSGTLPGGITLDPQTGVLAGTPTAPGTAHPVIALTDYRGASSVLTTPLSVQASPAAALPLLMTGARSVVEGHYAKYAVKADGTVLAWGGDTYGGLGDGSTTGQALSPTPIPGLTGVVSMSVNDDGSQYALKADGTVWAWGNNTYGQLGTGTTPTCLSPREVPGLTGVRALTVDGDSVFAVKADGTVSAWGRNDYAQLGNATVRDSSTPVQVAGLVGVKSLAPSPGGVIFALKIDGTLWSWGGLSGYNSPLPAAAIPHISGIRSLVARAAPATVYALKSDGTLWTDTTSFDHFAPVTGLSGVKSVSTSTRDGGPDSAFAVKTDGTVWSWGDNTFGVLGRTTPFPSSAAPAPIPGLTGVDRVSPNSFGRAIYAVKTDGSIWGCGEGSLDEFGTGYGNSAGSTVPVRVPGLGAVTDIFPEDESVYAMATDRSVWGWGHGVNRRLRDGTAGYSLPPLQLGSSNPYPAGMDTGQHPAGVAISPDGAAAYVTNEGSNSISVLDPRAETVRSTIAVGPGPRGVAVRPDGAQAYVTNSGDNTVSVIDTATGTLSATIPVGSGWGASGVAFTPDGAKAYVTNAGEGTVAVIHVASASLKAVVPVGVQPVAVSFTPDGSRVFVANSSDKTVSVIATASDQVVTTIPVGTGPRSIAVTPDGSKALITNTGTNSISIIDIATNRVSTVPVGSSPAGIALTAAGARALVAEAGSNELSLVEVASGKLLGTFPTGTSPSGVAVTPDGSRAVVTNPGGGNVSIVNLGPAMSAVLPSAATVGVPYAYQFTAGGLPSPGYRVSSGSLPAGLSLDGRTGTLSGTPTVPGTSTFGVTASNGIVPDAAASALTITVVKASTVPSTTIGAWRDFTG